MPRSWLALPLLSILATAALAQEVPGGPGGPLGQAGVRASERLPAQGLVVVQRDTGELVAMSNNGRYVIRGEIWDAWGKKKLASMDEVHASAASMPIEQLMAGRWGDLAPVTYGTGPRTVTLFVDPLCPYCHKLLQQLPALAADFTFRVLVVPVLGEDSGKATRKVGCAIDTAAAERMVLSADYSADLAQKPDCNLTPLQQRLVLASMIGLNGVPYLVLPSGKVQQGLPADLAALLAQG